MDPNNPPVLVHCPRCLCPLDARQHINVNVCLPASFPFPHAVPPNQGPADQHLANATAVPSSPPPVYQQNDGPAPTPTPPSEPSIPAPLPEPSTHQQAQGHNEEHTAQGDGRRTSASSSTSLDSVFSHWSITSQFVADLQAADSRYIPRQPAQASSPPPPPSSSPLVESPLSLYVSPNSSPPAQSSSQLAPDENPPTTRRWVVFRGRVPGIYTTSTEATSQTGGFSNAFMLAFDDPVAADDAYERFQVDGTIPTHSHGPWVVFIGRQPGVFTSYSMPRSEDLCASVVGFSNNCYRSCESIEEGYKALGAFRARLATAPPLSATTSAPEPAATDDSWWCCFAGAEPGVYNGLERLLQAAPAAGGVRRVDSEAKGWEMWTTYFAAGEVRVVPRT